MRQIFVVGIANAGGVLETQQWKLHAMAIGPNWEHHFATTVRPFGPAVEFGDTWAIAQAIRANALRNVNGVDVVTVDVFDPRHDLQFIGRRKVDVNDPTTLAGTSECDW